MSHPAACHVPCGWLAGSVVHGGLRHQGTPAKQGQGSSRRANSFANCFGSASASGGRSRSNFKLVGRRPQTSRTPESDAPKPGDVREHVVLKDQPID